VIVVEQLNKSYLAGTSGVRVLARPPPDDHRSM
jgi:hypothetical protein